MIDSKQRLVNENTVKILLTNFDRISGSTIAKPSYDMTRTIDACRSTFDINRPVYLFVDRFMNTGGASAPTMSALLWEELPASPNYIVSNSRLSKAISIHAGNSTTTANVVLTPTNNVLTAIELDPRSLMNTNTWNFRFVNAASNIFPDISDTQVGSAYLIGMTLFQKPSDKIDITRMVN